YAISFDVQRVCTSGVPPTINLINIQGDPGSSIDVKVFSTSNVAVPVDEFTVSFNNIIPITYQGAPAGTQHDWLTQVDNYFIVLSQTQGGCPNPLTSQQVLYNVSQEMTLVVEKVQMSLPEPRHTG